MKQELVKKLVGARVGGLFNGTPYSGIVSESIAEKDGTYNHIVALDTPMVRNYNNPTQSARNNRMVLNHINFATDSESADNFMMILADRY